MDEVVTKKKKQSLLTRPFWVKNQNETIEPIKRAFSKHSLVSLGSLVLCIVGGLEQLNSVA